MRKLSLTLALLAIALFVHAESIEQTYYFSQPDIRECNGYQQIGFQNCLPNGIVGEPTLPWQSISLMLPQGQEAVSVNVELFDFIELKGTFNLYPVQQPRPISSDKKIPFAKNESTYRSEEIYPSRNHSNVNTQFLNGVAFAFGGFTPVQYVPATGKVCYAQTVKVTIETTMSRNDHSRKLWLTPENEASLKRLAQNDILGTYDKRGREISGYDMLVITSEEWIPRFGEYLNLYNDKGIRTRIVALEEIYATMEGQDHQEQIRNYIIQEYEENGIQMINLGGDVSIVPYRSLYCWAQEGDEDQLPADMYYACLDGTLNDDGDDRWGEVGEDDLLPELGIGRLPFNNEAQFETIMHKTFSYLQTPVLGEFTSPILGAEHLGDGYYGSEDMERLIGENHDFDYTTYGYPENYNFKRYYATPTMNWSGSAFRNVIGTGGQYVHHVGHANTDVVAGWEMGMMGDQFFAGNDGTNHNYMLFHSHGCICGDFSHNCILEKMLTIETGFVVTTGNSRYGWYMPWGDGMAAHIHREMIDAYCHDRIATIGMALREAKIASAPWVAIPFQLRDEENGCLRWNIYCLNVLGDVALHPWFEEPFTPNVVYEQGLKTGTTSTTVNVNQYGTPLSNFCVSLFHDQTLLGRGITDENGDVELDFEAPLDVIGEMKLTVTGQSAWPQVFEVTGFDGSEAFVYGDIIDLNGDAIFGTSRMVSIDIYNKGDVSANVTAVLTSDCEYVFSESNIGSLPGLPANSTEHLEEGGLIEIADNIPDQTVFTLNLTTYNNYFIHSTQKSFLALAPNLQFANIDVDDTQGDGNGFIDQNETVTLQINGMNIGHATAPDAYLSASCNDNRIHLIDNQIQIGAVEPNGTFTAELPLSSDSDILGGTVFHLTLELHSGSYTTLHDYVFAVGVAVETFESGDFSFLEWEHGGDSHWFVTDQESHNGTYSARTGEIGNDEVTHLIIYTESQNDGEISFWFKTSTEEHKKDIFAFFVDGRKMDWWWGENGWTFASYEIKAGNHVCDWFYDKNSTGAGGQDCAWIDDITLPRTCIVTKVEEETIQRENTIYPSPTSGSFIIALAEESNILVFNTHGQLVKQMDKVSGYQQVDLSDAPKGLYYIRIQNRSNIETQKLIIN